MKCHKCNEETYYGWIQHPITFCIYCRDCIAATMYEDGKKQGKKEAEARISADGFQKAICNRCKEDTLICVPYDGNFLCIPCLIDTVRKEKGKSE